MVYVTGDTHAEFNKFSTKCFPDQKYMTKDDYVIINGDFGGIWDYKSSGSSEKYWLDWLEEKPFTLLFVDGNHENFDRLNQFPVVDYNGGKAHKIRSNIYHLMRGYVFDLNDHKFFAFGGARSHDIQDGVLDFKNYPTVKDLVNDYKKRTRKDEMLRINHLSWWKEELPSQDEMNRGVDKLKESNFQVDYVITHCLPNDIASMVGYYDPDILTMYFNSLLFDYKLDFHRWYCGHYHSERTIMNKFVVKYHNIERII